MASYIFNRRALAQCVLEYSLCVMVNYACFFLSGVCFIIYIYVKAEKGNTVWFPCKEKRKNLKSGIIVFLLIISILTMNNGMNSVRLLSATSEVRKKFLRRTRNILFEFLIHGLWESLELTIVRHYDYRVSFFHQFPVILGLRHSGRDEYRPFVTFVRPGEPRIQNFFFFLGLRDNTVTTQFLTTETAIKTGQQTITPPLGIRISLPFHKLCAQPICEMAVSARWSFEFIIPEVVGATLLTEPETKGLLQKWYLS